MEIPANFDVCSAFPGTSFADITETDTLFSFTDKNLKGRHSPDPFQDSHTQDREQIF